MTVKMRFRIRIGIRVMEKGVSSAKRRWYPGDRARGEMETESWAMRCEKWEMETERIWF